MLCGVIRLTGYSKQLICPVRYNWNPSDCPVKLRQYLFSSRRVFLSYSRPDNAGLAAVSERAGAGEYQEAAHLAFPVLGSHPLLQPTMKRWEHRLDLTTLTERCSSPAQPYYFR